VTLQPQVVTKGWWEPVLWDSQAWCRGQQFGGEHIPHLRRAAEGAVVPLGECVQAQRVAVLVSGVRGVQVVPKKSVVQRCAAEVVHVPLGKCVLVQLVMVLVSAVLVVRIVPEEKVVAPSAVAEGVVSWEGSLADTRSVPGSG
jgi:hypothetical protein